MNVTAIAVGVGALCLASAGAPQATPVPLFSGPVFVTAPGTTNTVAALEVLRTVDLPFTLDPERVGRTDGRDWPKVGSYKTLVIVPGFRVGAEDWGALHPDELNRIRALIAQAKKANASILLLHLGERRSRGSGANGGGIDDSNLSAAKAADYMVVAGDGNKDGFFTAQAATRGIPVESVATVADASAAVMRLFKVGPRVSPGSVGSVLPPLTGRAPDGSTFEFASLRGRWLALHFWTAATREIAKLRTHQAKYGERVQFVGVAVDSYESQWKRTIDDVPANWRHVLNGTGDQDLAARFDVHVLPMRFLVDPSGRVVGRFVRDDDFFTKLDELFKRP